MIAEDYINAISVLVNYNLQGADRIRYDNYLNRFRIQHANKLKKDISNISSDKCDMLSSIVKDALSGNTRPIRGKGNMSDSEECKKTLNILHSYMHLVNMHYADSAKLNHVISVYQQSVADLNACKDEPLPILHNFQRHLNKNIINRDQFTDLSCKSTSCIIA